MTADRSHRRPHRTVTVWAHNQARRRLIADQRAHEAVRTEARRAGLLPPIPTLAQLVEALL